MSNNYDTGLFILCLIYEQTDLPSLRVSAPIFIDIDRDGGIYDTFYLCHSLEERNKVLRY